MNNKNKSHHEKPFWKRPVPVTIFVIVILLVAGSFYLMSYAESMIEDRVVTELNKEFSPDSEWEIGEVDVQLFPLGVSLYDIRLNHTTPFQDQQFEKVSDALRDFTAESIKVSGLSLKMLFSNDEYKAGRIEINSPTIGVLYRQEKEIDTGGTGEMDQEFELDEFDLINATIEVYKYRADNEPSSEIAGLNISLADISYSESVKSLNELVSYYALSLESITHKMQDDNYQLELGRLEFSSSNNVLEIQHTKLRPLLSLQELSAKLGEQTDHMDVVSGPIKVHKLDSDKWADINTLAAGLIEIDGLKLYISRDKNFPKKERTEKELLNVAFRNLDFDMDVDSVHWTNGVVSYEETEEGLEQSGRVYFEEIDLKISGLQNRDVNNPISIDAQTLFMNEAMLNVKFLFTLEENGRHTIEGDLAPIELDVINEVIVPLAFVRIDDGRVDQLTFEFEATDSLASGEMIVIYEDLNIKKVDSETLEQTTTSRIVSFVANLAVVKSSNSEDGPRVGEIEFEREKEKSMFSYWWKALRSGLKSSAGM